MVLNTSDSDSDSDSNFDSDSDSLFSYGYGSGVGGEADPGIDGGDGQVCSGPLFSVSGLFFPPVYDLLVLVPCFTGYFQARFDLNVCHDGLGGIELWSRAIYSTLAETISVICLLLPNLWSWSS